jgi:hypothetical protein
MSILALPKRSLDWENANEPAKSFKRSFLPTDDKLVSVAIAEGLVRKIDLGDKKLNANQTDLWYVINPKDFRVRTHSVIPIKDCTSRMQQTRKLGAASDVPVNKEFGIAPMGKTSAQVGTSHYIKVTRNNQAADASFVLSPVVTKVPGGLWAAEGNSDDVNAKSLIENALVGFEIVPAATTVPGHTQSIPRSQLCYNAPHNVSGAYSDATVRNFKQSPDVPVPGDDPAKNASLWGRIQTEIHANNTRAQMLTALGFTKTDLDIGEDFTSDAAYAPLYGSLI